MATENSPKIYTDAEIDEAIAAFRAEHSRFCEGKRGAHFCDMCAKFVAIVGQLRAVNSSAAPTTIVRFKTKPVPFIAGLPPLALRRAWGQWERKHQPGKIVIFTGDGNTFCADWRDILDQDSVSVNDEAWDSISLRPSAGLTWEYVRLSAAKILGMEDACVSVSRMVHRKLLQCLGMPQDHIDGTAAIEAYDEGYSSSIPWRKFPSFAEIENLRALGGDYPGTWERKQDSGIIQVSLRVNAITRVCEFSHPPHIPSDHIRADVCWGDWRPTMHGKPIAWKLVA